MDQRMFLALGLSMAVIFGYYFLFPPASPPRKPAETPATVQEKKVDPQEKQPGSTQGTPAVQQAVKAPASRQSQLTEAKVVTVETPNYLARFDSRGAVLTSLQLKHYLVHKPYTDWGDLIPPLRKWIDKPPMDETARVEMVRNETHQAEPFSILFGDDPRLSAEFRNLVFSADQARVVISNDKAAPARLVFSASGSNGLTVNKIFTIHPESYIIDYEIQVINYGKQPYPLRLMSVFGEGPLQGAKTDGVQTRFGPVFREDGSVDTEDADDIEEKMVVRNPDWVGIAGNYFISAVAKESAISHAEFRSKALSTGGDEDKFIAWYGMEMPVTSLGQDKMVTSKFKMYIGPKKVSEMDRFGNGLADSLDMNLETLATPLLAMLRWFHSYVGNYGIAIILLTIVVRVAMFPLTYKGMLSMKRMQKLQPKMTAIREKFKNDRERMNREMMGMYKKYKVNPLGGCLPIALQIPIFFALYSALLGAIELRHSPFYFWLDDLSYMDPLYITPLLMGATMFLQQKLTPTAMDPTQQKIMMWMPMVFMVFMFNFPSGLVLYWLTSNVLSILQQLIINRINVPDPVEQG